MYREIPVSLVNADKEYDFDIFLKIHDKQRLFAARGARLTDDHISICVPEIRISLCWNKIGILPESSSTRDGPMSSAPLNPKHQKEGRSYL